MTMQEEELRALVREAVSRHLGRVPATRPQAAVIGPHPSHFVLPLQAGTDDGSCVIEPDVRCTHCNYCRSLGH
jgi:hypothetical protein